MLFPSTGEIGRTAQTNALVCAASGLSWLSTQSPWLYLCRSVRILTSPLSVPRSSSNQSFVRWRANLYFLLHLKCMLPQKLSICLLKRSCEWAGGQSVQHHTFDTSAIPPPLTALQAKHILEQLWAVRQVRNRQIRVIKFCVFITILSSYDQMNLQECPEKMDNKYIYTILFQRRSD